MSGSQKRKWGVLLLYKNRQTTKRKIPEPPFKGFHYPIKLHVPLSLNTFPYSSVFGESGKGFILQGCPPGRAQGLFTRSPYKFYKDPLSVNTVAWGLMGLTPQDLRSRQTINSTGRGTWTVLPSEIYDIHEFTEVVWIFLLNGESIKPKLLGLSVESCIDFNITLH